MISYLKERWRLFRKYKQFLSIDFYNVPLELVYDFINTLDRNTTMSRVRKFKKWPVSKRLIKGESFHQMIMDREFESGTFGDEFKKWTIKQENAAVDLFKISVEAAPRSKNPSKLFEAFQRQSMIQHDLMHFFNGYDTGTQGEVAVLSFHLGHEWKESWAFFILIGAWSSLMFSILPSKYPKGVPFLLWLRYIPIWYYIKICIEAYRRGKNSFDFFFVDWEDKFNKPLEEVKAELGIKGPPKYWDKTRYSRVAWKYNARKRTRGH
jgi:ubiquinone biosynthesis protein Coq4